MNYLLVWQYWSWKEYDSDIRMYTRKLKFTKMSTYMVNGLIDCFIFSIILFICSFNLLCINTIRIFLFVDRSGQLKLWAKRSIWSHIEWLYLHDHKFLCMLGNLRTNSSGSKNVYDSKYYAKYSPVRVQ